jgi:hypothetical protein
MNKTERDTKQRAAIKGAIARATRPLTVSEIHEQAQVAVPNCGIATVYRNLKTLHERGEAATICGLGTPPSYANADVADKCMTDVLYQVGNALYFDEPKGWICDNIARIKQGHIES